MESYEPGLGLDEAQEGPGRVETLRAPSAFRRSACTECSSGSRKAPSRCIADTVEALRTGIMELGRGNPLGIGMAVSAVSCFMFAMVQRTIPNAGGAWICASPALLFMSSYAYHCCYYSVHDLLYVFTSLLL